MAEAKCMRCLAHATGDTFEDAKCKINHAVGLSRGIPCGDNYNKVVDVTPEIKDTPKPSTKPVDTTKSYTSKSKSKKSKSNTDSTLESTIDSTIETTIQ